MKINCPNCGKIIEASDAFCKYCGISFNEMSLDDNLKKEKWQRHQNFRALFAAIFLIIISIFLFVLGIILIFQKRKTTSIGLVLGVSVFTLLVGLLNIWYYKRHR